MVRAARLGGRPPEDQAARRSPQLRLGRPRRRHPGQGRLRAARARQHRHHHGHLQPCAPRPGCRGRRHRGEADPGRRRPRAGASRSQGVDNRPSDPEQARGGEARSTWSEGCERGDSNPHVRRHRDLNCPRGVLAGVLLGATSPSAGQMPPCCPVLYPLIPGCRGPSREQSREHRGPVPSGRGRLRRSGPSRTGTDRPAGHGKADPSLDPCMPYTASRLRGCPVCPICRVDCGHWKRQSRAELSFKLYLPYHHLRRRHRFS
jgi:hypothetical protein